MFKNSVRVFCFLIIIFLSVFNLTSPSYGAESGKMGIVDLQKVMQESEKGKQAFESFQKELKEKKEKLESEEKELEKLKKEVLEGLPNWSDKKLKDYHDEKDDFEEQIKKENFELNKKIVNEIMDVIDEIAKKENYTIIFETESVIYFSPRLDITEKIIEKYNVKTK